MYNDLSLSLQTNTKNLGIPVILNIALKLRHVNWATNRNNHVTILLDTLREKGVSSIYYRKPVEFSSGLCASQDINVKTEKSHNWRSYTNKIKHSDSENNNCVYAFFENESSKTVENPARFGGTV